MKEGLYVLFSLPERTDELGERQATAVGHLLPQCANGGRLWHLNGGHPRRVPHS